MGQDSGTTPTKGSGSVTRWYHNPITGNCERFAYRGAKGNANNFETKDQCESYCVSASCERGNPRYSSVTPVIGGAAVKANRVYCTGSGTNVCSSNHDCKQIGSISLCCPKASFVCSKTGALFNTPLDTNYDSGLQPGDTSVTYSRWYYDVTEKRCLSFTYFGQAGNYNNFMSQGHCESYCAKVVCDAGEPLKDQSGVRNLQCSSSSTCPATHDCVTEGVCCPKKQHVCSQVKAPGTCGNYVERWWYNSQTRNCESFTFSGCQGNDNNFGTYTDCQDYCKDATTPPQCPQGTGLKDSYGNYIVCGGTSQTTTQTCPANYLCYYDGKTYGCCPNRAYTCSLAYDAGTQCGPTVSRWYYNAVSKVCQTYTYNGCDGNSNNFATQTDCQDYCGVGGCPNGGEPYKENNGQYRSCSNGISCPNTHYCTQVTLGTTTTYNYCCPTKTYVCGLPRDQGTKCGSTTLARYFFNVVTRNCESFNYAGCDGNRNNYATMNQCLNYCNSAACPSGQIAASDINNNQLSTCVLGTPGSCEAGYSCTYSSLLGQNVCCGSPVSADTCPAGQSAYISEFTQSALQCQPNVQGSCPSGFVCWYSVAQNQYYCCGTSTVQCPKGGQAYIENTTNAARQCTPGVNGACPSNYECQATNLNIGNVMSTTGYCCGVSGVCGTNYESYNIEGRPVQCANNNPEACPAGYSCRASPGTQEIYCCRPAIDTSVVTNVCAAYQELPYVVSQAPVVCSSNNPATTCPSPYQCRNYAATNTFYCCQPAGSNINPSQTQCPPGSNALTPLRFCQPSSPGTLGNCPAGSFCQYDPTQSRYICCGQGNFQPEQSILCDSGPAYLTASRQALNCVIGASNNCPTGYGCQYVARAGGNYCCPGGNTQPTGSGGCPRGTPFMYLNTNIPLACNNPSTSASQCPSGYQCVASTLYPGSFQCCSLSFRRAQADDEDAITGPVHDDVEVEEGVDMEDILADGKDRLILATRFGALCESDIQCKNLSPFGLCDAFHRHCACEAPFLVYLDSCVSECPEGTEAHKSGVCVPSLRAHNKYSKSAQPPCGTILFPEPGREGCGWSLERDVWKAGRLRLPVQN